MLLAVGALLVAAGSYFSWRGLQGPLPPLAPGAKAYASATVLNDSKPVPAFSFRRPDGSAFTEADLRGHWTFVFFGYTQCPDICPTALTAMKDIKARLTTAGQVSPAVVFISVDPARDPPELLGQYVPAFDPAFLGVAPADDGALLPLAKHLGVFFKRNNETDKQHYTVDHTAAIYLIDPEARLKALFSGPPNPKAMAEDFRALAQGDSGK